MQHFDRRHKTAERRVEATQSVVLFLLQWEQKNDVLLSGAIYVEYNKRLMHKTMQPSPIASSRVLRAPTQKGIAVDTLLPGAGLFPLISITLRR